MKFLKWNIDELREIQYKIGCKVSIKNEVSDLTELKTVGGADVSFNRFSKIGHAAVVVMSYPDLQIIENVTVTNTLQIPYIPGYLAFREWPLVHECLQKIKNQPQILICDGHGIAHPRRAGLASHIGVEENLVTVGCAKSLFVGEYEEPKIEKGSVSDLFLKGEKIGEVVRSRRNVKPIFVSPGHKIDFSHATQLILSLSQRYRLPEPIRAAHGSVNRLRIEHSP